MFKILNVFNILHVKKSYYYCLIKKIVRKFRKKQNKKKNRKNIKLKNLIGEKKEKNNSFLDFEKEKRLRDSNSVFFL